MKILSLFRAASAAFFFATAAYAQQPGAVANHAVPLGRGAGVAGYGAVGPCTSAFAIIGAGASADPACGQIDLTAGVKNILSGANGGTNNGFMQFSGPTTSIKTYALPNASDTIATIAAAQTLTNKTISGAALSGTLSGSPTFSGDPLFTGLASGTCANSLLINAGNAMILGACPGAAASIQVGTTTVTSGTTLNLLYNNAGTLGNATLASFLTAGSGIAITGTTSPTIAQSLTNTTVEASPSSPTATISTTAVFMGLGASCHITPTYSGRIKIEVIGVLNAAGGAAATTTIRFGTSTAPINGAAVGGTGSQVGAPISIAGSGSTTVATPFVNGGIVTGLTPGTAYWFDATLFTSSAAQSQSISSPSCNAFEF